MKIECKCGALNHLEDTACWKCKTPITEEQRAEVRQANIEEHRADEAARLQADAATRESVNKARASGDWTGIPDHVIRDEAGKIIATTSFLVAGRVVVREIDIVTAECVYGMNLVKDIFAGARDVFGGRSAVTEDALRDARRTVLAELRKEALLTGADAVIGVALDYHELTGGQKGGMIMLVASGTAVTTRPA